MSGQHEVTAKRVNDPSKSKPLDPSRFRWRRVRYLPHQNVREAARRLKQITRQQLTGAVVTSEARVTAERLRLFVEVSRAERACNDYVNQAIVSGDEDRLPGRDHLFVAVSDLRQFLSGHAPIETASTSAGVLGASAAAAGGDRRDDVAA